MRRSSYFRNMQKEKPELGQCFTKEIKANPNKSAKLIADEMKSFRLRSARNRRNKLNEDEAENQEEANKGLNNNGEDDENANQLNNNGEDDENANKGLNNNGEDDENEEEANKGLNNNGEDDEKGYQHRRTVEECPRIG